MTPKEANQNLLKFIAQHLLMIQSGNFGIPTENDLDFCGKLHILLEDNLESEDNPEG